MPSSAVPKTVSSRAALSYLVNVVVLLATSGIPHARGDGVVEKVKIESPGFVWQEWEEPANINGQTIVAEGLRKTGLSPPSTAVRRLEEEEQVGPVPQVSEEWPGTTPNDLSQEYYNIFHRYGNRNAASHLWSKFLLERSAQMRVSRFTYLFNGFCPVSGSPVSPRDGNRYLMSLDRADGTGKEVGYLHFCCWPCVCDTRELIKVDTATVPTLDGPRQFRFLVIGNPCAHPEELTKVRDDPFSRGGKYTLKGAAPEVTCEGEDGKTLHGAPMSDNGFVIIGMLQDFPGQADGIGTLKMPPVQGEEAKPGELMEYQDMQVQHAEEFRDICTERAARGHDSGMGTIFRAVALISPFDGESSALQHTQHKTSDGKVVTYKSSENGDAKEENGDTAKTAAAAAFSTWASSSTKLFTALLVGLLPQIFV